MLLAALLVAAAVATTGPADAITPSSATLTGTVDPGGADATYHFEYGTSSAYGLTTPETDAGSGTSPVSVSAGISGLTADTTYHYRLVAGTSDGADRTFRTGANPKAPTIGSLSATGVGPTSATLRADVNPNKLATTMHFEYGTSTSYGARTAEQGVGSGSSSVLETAAIGGLKPNTRYHFRAVATNAAGIARGGDHSFVTSRTPTGVTLTASTTRPVWGSGLTLTGKVSGQGSIPVALEVQDFPFDHGFRELARTNANGSGSFSFSVPALFSTTRLRATTRTAIPVSSAVITASVAVKVGLRTHRLHGRRVRLTGAIWPAVPKGLVSLQRRTHTGRWILVRHVAPRPLAGNRSSYRVTVARHRARTYRVLVVARDGGAHVPGASRAVTVR
jgi:hypothetical protein